MFDGPVFAKQRRVSLGLALALLLVVALALPVQAQEAPDVIPLPDGWQPEGIALGPGSTFYVGSLATGGVYSGDLRTGEGEILVPEQEDRVAVGLGLDNWSRKLFVAGGAGGAAYVYDTITGESLAEYPLTDPAGGTFVNDVVVTEDAAYLTDSMRPVFYRIPLGVGDMPRLPDPSEVEEIELTGDFQFVEGEFNSNGIEATDDGETLFIINSTVGALYRVDPETGEATEIEVTGGELTMGDGLYLDGQTMYVVRNRLNEIAVVELDAGFESGEVVDTITSDLFDVPTTIAKYGPWLYAVNARFGTDPMPDTEYNVVRVHVGL